MRNPRMKRAWRGAREENYHLPVCEGYIETHILKNFSYLSVCKRNGPTRSGFSPEPVLREKSNEGFSSGQL